jgi:hypothetical protein
MILAIVNSLRLLRDGLSVLWVLGKISFSKISLSDSNCWRCTPNDLAVD